MFKRDRMVMVMAQLGYIGYIRCLIWILQMHNAHMPTVHCFEKVHRNTGNINPDTQRKTNAQKRTLDHFYICYIIIFL